MTWHADRDDLRAYTAGTTSWTVASSIEAHVLECAECRAELAATSREQHTARLASIKLELVDAADQGRVPLGERLLRRVGVRDHVARLLAATPSLRASWLLSIAFVLAFAVAIGRTGAGDDGLLLLLVVAPLLPLVGIAAAFGPAVEPSYEIGLATPMHGFRLLLIRSAAVLIATVAMAALATLAMPHVGWLGVAWLLPALALTCATLALSTWFAPMTAAAIAASGWLALVLAAVRDSRRTGGRFAAVAVDHLSVTGTAGQVVFVAIALAAAAVILWRRPTIDLGRPT